MGLFNTFCCICCNTNGGLFDELFDIQDDTSPIKINYNDVKWLEDCTFLTVDNRIIHNCDSGDLMGIFQDKDGTQYYVSKDMLDDDKSCNGIALHTDCWNFVKKTIKINLTYGDLPIIKQNRVNFLLNIKYDDITKYHHQDFDFERLQEDNKLYYALSPLKDERSARRVKKILNQIKLKNDSKRKAPNVSATFYKTGMIKIGNDKNFWIINKGKWSRMAVEPILYSLELLEREKCKIKKVRWGVYIGEWSTEPFFECNNDTVLTVAAFITCKSK